MTTRQKAPSILTEVGARQLTDRLVTTLTEAHELLIDLWVGRAWEALHYANWAAFCEAELGDLLFVKLPPAMRAEAAAHMKQAGMSYRNIAAPLGVSPASIHADLAPPKPKPSVQKLNTPRAPMPADPVPLPRAIVDDVRTWQTVVRHVSQAGAVGLTCAEFERDTGWGHGSASPAFLRARKKGYIVHSGEFRAGPTGQGYAAYVCTHR